MMSKSLSLIALLAILLCATQGLGNCPDHLQEIQKIEHDFHAVKQEAEKEEAKLKKTSGSALEHFEKEFKNFVANYSALMQLIESKPAFCERVIQELRDSIEYFKQHFLPHANAHPQE